MTIPKPETEERSTREEFLAGMERIMMLARASRGLPPEPTDAISNLVNPKSPLERSRFPTYPILQKAVYLYLGYWKYKAEVLKEWADDECSALIEYKGLGRKEWVEATKRTREGDETSFYFGRQQGQQLQPTAKRRFWQRAPKDQSEFKHQ